MHRYFRVLHGPNLSDVLGERTPDNVCMPFFIVAGHMTLHVQACMMSLMMS